jgi:outer membrane protein
MHYEQLENRPLGPGLSLPVIDDQYSGSIGLMQPLYTGGRVTHLARSARLHVLSTEGGRSAAEADLLLMAITTYWSWSKAVHLAEALDSAVTRVTAQTQDTRHLREAGMATDNDLLAGEVLLDQVRLRRDDARRQTEVVRTEIERLTGAALASAARPFAPVCPATPTYSLTDVLVAAATNRAEIAALRAEAEAAETAAKAVRADSRPQLSLVTRHEWGRPNLRNFPPSDEWADDTYVGATLSWTLWDSRMTASRAAEARARAAQIRWQLDDVRDRVQAQAKEAWLSLQFAVVRVQTAAHAEAGARKSLSVATDLWKNGLARNSDALDAQARLTDACYQRIASEADAVVAEANLRYAMGLLRIDDAHDKR